MKAAIRDNNPVLFFEYKYLYRRIKGEGPGRESMTVEIGKGTERREGNDIAMFTYGSTVHHSLEAAEVVAKEDGIEATVVDLRTLAAA